MASNSNLPTVGGCSFLSSPPNQTFAPEDFGSDERLMIETAEQFSRGEVLTRLTSIDQQEPGVMPGLIRQAGQLGFCGPDTPEAYGGLGLPKNLAARMLEMLSLNGSFSVTIGITSGISQSGLVLFGSEEQKSRLLPGLAAGEQIGAYALSEPNSGSDALSMTTRAVRDGSDWILNGTKMWISNAQWAHQFLVMARCDEGVAAFVVERSMSGVSVGREEHKMGLKGSSTARLLLEDVRVPAENALYIPGKGHVVALNALNLGRFKLSSMSIGPAREAIGLAARYALERKQFGRPIAEFGLIRQKLALSAALFFAAESAIYRTGAMIDDAFHALSPDGSDPECNRAAAEEYAVECSLCKLFSTEAESTIADEAIQVYGGYGFTEEFPVARIYRDARVSRIYEGTNEINRVFVSTRLRKKLCEGSLDLTGEADTYAGRLAIEVAQRLLSGDSRPPQEAEGALADLVTLAYVCQSAQARASRIGVAAAPVMDAVMNWCGFRAIEAYHRALGEMPDPPKVPVIPTNEIAEAVLSSPGPLAF